MNEHSPQSNLLQIMIIKINKQNQDINILAVHLSSTSEILTHNFVIIQNWVLMCEQTSNTFVCV